MISCNHAHYKIWIKQALCWTAAPLGCGGKKKESEMERGIWDTTHFIFVKQSCRHYITLVPSQVKLWFTRYGLCVHTECGSVTSLDYSLLILMMHVCVTSSSTQLCHLWACWKMCQVPGLQLGFKKGRFQTHRQLQQQQKKRQKWSIFQLQFQTEVIQVSEPGLQSSLYFLCCSFFNFPLCCKKIKLN